MRQPVDYERPQTQDERLDEFYLWVGTTKPQASRALRRLAVGAALGSVLAVALAVAMSGYL